MLFLYFVFIAHFTKFTRESSLFMENLCSWKNQKRKKVLGEKTRRKEERKGTTLSGKEKKNLLWKRLVLAELLRWLPDFEQRSRCQSKIWRTWCWKRGYLFFMQVPALIQKTSTSASNRDFKAVCRFVVLLLSSFCGFSIFAAGFSFAFGNFARYCNVLLNAPLSDRDKKKSVWNGLLFPGNLDPSSLTPGGPIVLLVCGFRRRNNLLTWRELFANLYELKSGIWFWEEYNYFERI